MSKALEAQAAARRALNLPYAFAIEGDHLFISNDDMDRIAGKVGIKEARRIGLTADDVADKGLVWYVAAQESAR